MLVTDLLFYVPIAVCDGVLQQTLGQIEGGSQADVPEDHLQVADLWFGLLWSQGEHARPPPSNHKCKDIYPTHRLQIDSWLWTRTLKVTQMLFSKPQRRCYPRFSWSPSTSMESVSLTQRRRFVWERQRAISLSLDWERRRRTQSATFGFQTGHTDCSPLHQDLQLEQWQHLLSHHHREPGQRKQTSVWNLSGESDTHEENDGSHLVQIRRRCCSLSSSIQRTLCRSLSQGYKMDDLLTSYISQMLTTMNQRSGREHSKWSSRWQGAKELVQILRPVGQPCSWSRTFANQLWTMSRSRSGGSAGSLATLQSSTGSSTWDHDDDDEDDEDSSEEDYLWDTMAHLVMLTFRTVFLVWVVAWGDECRDGKTFVVLFF